MPVAWHPMRWEIGACQKMGKKKQNQDLLIKSSIKFWSDKKLAKLGDGGEKT